METKHTPGNWKASPFRNADDHGEYIEIVSDFRKTKDHINIVAKLYDYNYDGREPDPNYSQDETNQLANARLIAAAPEMLEALIGISEGKGRYDLDPIQHAANCIEDMKTIALEVIKKVTTI